MEKDASWIQVLFALIFRGFWLTVGACTGTLIFSAMFEGIKFNDGQWVIKNIHNGYLLFWLVSGALISVGYLVKIIKQNYARKMVKNRLVSNKQTVFGLLVLGMLSPVVAIINGISYIAKAVSGLLEWNL